MLKRERNGGEFGIKKKKKILQSLAEEKWGVLPREINNDAVCRVISCPVEFEKKKSRRSNFYSNDGTDVKPRSDVNGVETFFNFGRKFHGMVHCNSIYRGL